jgi:hypothetical protein
MFSDPSLTRPSPENALRKLYSDPPLPVCDSDSGADSGAGSVEVNDLLKMLRDQQSDRYRDVQFIIDDHKDANPNYKNRVSFNTIDIQYSEASPHYDRQGTDDSTWSRETDRLKVSNERRGRSMSPASSPRAMSPYGTRLSPAKFVDPLDVKKMFNALKAQYPSTPIVTHRGCTFTRTHCKFEDLYARKIENSKPVLPGRTILVYISGRKHTWVALDWVLRYFLEDGDTVIVVSAINSKKLKTPQFSDRRGSFGTASGPGTLNPKSNNTMAPQTSSALTARMRFRMRHSHQYMETLARNVMNYMMEVVNPNVIAKISLELVIGNTRDVLQEMYKLYEPNLVCTAAKVNSNFSAPLRSWTSSKLTDQLVHKFPLPTIIVPAMNMYNMERRMENEINLKHADHTKEWASERHDTPALGKLINDNSEEDHDRDRGSISSDMTSDTSSVASDLSYDSYEEISKFYYQFRRSMTKSIAELKTRPMNEDYFKNFLVLISDKSAEFCDEIRAVDPDFKGKGAKLARSITGSNAFGISPYKTKSLLSPLERPEKPPLTTGVSFKDIKRNLKLNTQNLGNSPTPTINIESPSPSASVPSDISGMGSGNSSSLKFVDSELPSQRRKRGIKYLQKSLSHDDPTTREPPSIEPVRSHPAIITARNTNGKSKSHKQKASKKRFWGKIFG